MVYNNYTHFINNIFNYLLCFKVKYVLLIILIKSARFIWIFFLDCFELILFRNSHLKL